MILNPLYADSEDKLQLYYFYSEDCGSCDEISVYLDSIIPGNYKNIEIKKFEVANDSDNLNLLFHILEQPDFKTDQKEIEVPVIFIENTALIGEDDITSNLENLLEKADKSENYKNNAETR